VLRKSVVHLATAAAVLGLAGQALAQPIGLGTSPQGTFTYQLGATVAKEVTEVLKLQARVQPSSGTGAMIPLVNNGEVDFGFCNSMELYEAFHGVRTFDKSANPNIRTAAVLFPLLNGFFVRADSPIKTVADLKGKTISYGFTSQEILKYTVDAMLATGGLAPSDVKTVMVPNVLRGADELIAGRVDMTTFAIGGPKTAEADAAVGIRFLDLGNTPEAQAALKKHFQTSYLARVEPAPNRPGVKAPLYTMHYDYTMFVNAKVPAEKVKQIVAVVAERISSMAETTPGFRTMKVERIYNDVGVPFHEGAVAYFKEKNIQPTK
jgi:uncharacterized protein